MEKRKYKVGIVTLSDKGSRGEREDLSGPKIQELLPDDRYEVVSYRILPDDQPAIEKELCTMKKYNSKLAEIYEPKVEELYNMYVDRMKE